MASVIVAGFAGWDKRTLVQQQWSDVFEFHVLQLPLPVSPGSPEFAHFHFPGPRIAGTLDPRALLDTFPHPVRMALGSSF
jgi:hypothetical protein